MREPSGKKRVTGLKAPSLAVFLLEYERWCVEEEVQDDYDEYLAHASQEIDRCVWATLGHYFCFGAADSSLIGS